MINQQAMKPNTTELEILKLLWQKEPRTARELHEEIAQQFEWSYSSTRKTLERMHDKGFLNITQQGNKKAFTATLLKMPTLALYANDFAKNILEIDGPLPIAMFTDSRLIESDELDELQSLLDDLADEENK